MSFCILHLKLPFVFLTASHSFPYVKTRILVVQEEQYELTPIEVSTQNIKLRLKIW